MCGLHNDQLWLFLLTKFPFYTFEKPHTLEQNVYQKCMVLYILFHFASHTENLLITYVEFRTIDRSRLRSYVGCMEFDKNTFNPFLSLNMWHMFEYFFKSKWGNLCVYLKKDRICKKEMSVEVEQFSATIFVTKNNVWIFNVWKNVWLVNNL